MASRETRILIVDDIADNSFLLKTFLESKGFTVDVADSGAAALETMQAAPPNLVLLDVMMPGMDGYEVTRRIRRDQRLHSIPVVLISAFIESCRIKGLGVGATDFVRKPVNFDELLAQIEMLLQHRNDKDDYEFPSWHRNS